MINRVQPRTLEDFFSYIGNNDVRTVNDVLTVANKFKNLPLDQALDQMQLLVDYATFIQENDKASAAKKWLNRDDLLKTIKAVPNPRDKAIVLALYEGLMGYEMSDILGIKKEDVTPDGIFIRSRNQLFPASKELIDAFDQSIDKNTYENLSIFREKHVCALFEDGSALKSTDPDKGVTPAKIRYKVPRIMEYCGIDKCSASDLRRWGMYDYILKHCEKHSYNPVDYIRKGNKKELFDRYGVRQINSTRIIKEMKELGLIDQATIDSAVSR